MRADDQALYIGSSRLWSKLSNVYVPNCIMYASLQGSYKLLE